MTKSQVEDLSRALKKQFHAKVEFEPVNNNGRYRFAVSSKDFAQMTQLQRQDAIWKVVDETLPREATLGISLILAFAPAELATAAK